MEIMKETSSQEKNLHNVQYKIWLLILVSLMD